MGKRMKNLRAIFLKALEIEDREQRNAYLDEACSGDNKLRTDVEALLKAHEKAGDFLESPPVGANVTLDSPSPIERPGTRIGHYELLELIGEGGMGLVYLAEQKEPVKRRVALKIIKPGMDSKQVIARFEAERQVLALLDHPNIAHVLDAGTTGTGRPYFVMEYVKGLSITRYCDDNKLNIEQRLKLFRQACEGIHHAHQKGIIHRDIKPSNILVAVQDDKAVPKIIDFGIAKAATQPLTDKTFFTSAGQLLGTPQYMSPEQVDLATHDIDTRSDIYSLGVMLYELLAGVLPFEAERFERAGLSQIQHTIREVEPASPSIRLTALGDDAKAIAASRGTQVIPLARRLHRELEWIPLKAMRKERVRRYRSASELADDIQNYLNGNPLIAGPETAIYRVKKFMRRHAGSVATVMLVAAAITLGLIISTAMYFRAERMRVRAEQAREKETIARTQAEQSEKVAQEQRDLADEQRSLAEKKAEELRRNLYVSNIQLADSKYREGNIRRVRELLVACPNDLQGWEWNRLNHICDQSVMTLRGGGFFAVIFSPDGKYIISGGWDHTITVWDATTGKELRTLRGHEDVVYSLAISRDGRRIVSGSEDKTIRIWDLATGDEVKTIRGHKGYIDSVAFSPDGKLIASNDSGGNVAKVWSAETGTELMILDGHKGRIYQVMFSPDGKRIVSSHDSGELKFWDAVTGKELMTVLAERGFPCGMAFSFDGKKVASVGMDWGSAIKIWDSESGKLIMIIQGDHARALSIAFSPDGRYIAKTDTDNTIKVWDAETGGELKTFRGHDWFTLSVSFSPDSKRLVSCSWDGTVKLWDVTIDRERFDLHKHSDEAFVREGSDIPSAYHRTVTSVAFSPEGRRIASASYNRIVTLWDVKTGTEITALQRQGTRVVFSPDGKRIAVSGREKSFKIYDVKTGAEVMTFSGHKGLVEAVAFSQDGKLIASGGREDKTIKVWNAISGEEIISLAMPESSVMSIVFSPDNKHIVSGNWEGTLDLWDLSSDAEPMIIGRDGPPIASVAFSPDGKRFISGGYDRTVRIWDAANGSEIMTLHGHGDLVTSVTFMPDGKRIISGGREGTIKLWDSTTGTELLSIGVQRGVYSVALSLNGKTIAAGTDDGSILLLESAEPEGGYEPRKNGELARKSVDGLHHEHAFYYDVIDALETDTTLNEPIRKLALQIANSRKWEDTEKLRNEAWATVNEPGKSVAAYQDALAKVEKADGLESDDPAILNVLGGAQYRVGSYEDAWKTLVRSAKILSDEGEELDPVNTAFTAMTLHKIGQVEQAKIALEQVRELCKEGPFSENIELQSLLAESEAIIVGEQL